MEIADYTYHRPRSLKAACELGRRFGATGRYLAGGTELLVDLKHKRDAAEHVISLRDLDELRRITVEDDGTLCLGALCSLSAVAASDDVARLCPELREAVLKMAGMQIRNQATIGGNFARAVPCADTPPICIACGATVRLTGVEADRTLPAEDFAVAPRRTVLEHGEILTEIRIPPRPSGFGASYRRFQLRGGMALAVAAVAAAVRLERRTIAEARVVLNSVAPVPLRARGCEASVTGREPSADLLAAAGRTAAEESQPIDDLRGSAAFRRELVAVLAAQALGEAVARAGGGPS